jgi:hypothetical protein
MPSSLERDPYRHRTAQRGMCSRPQEIDICTIVTDSRRQGRCIQLKILQAGPRNYLLDADLSCKPLPPEQPIISLKECIRSPIESSPVTMFWEGLSIREKCILAFVLANTALELYKSQWMYEKWTKDQIYFKRLGSLGVPYLRTPYLAVHFRDRQDSLPKLDVNGCPSIFDLGIMLFEVYANAFVEDTIIDQSTFVPRWAARATVLDLINKMDNKKNQEGFYDQTWSVHGLYRTAIVACLSHDRFIQSDPGCDPGEKLRDILKFEVIRPLRSILMKGYHMTKEELDNILFGGLQVTPSGLPSRGCEPQPSLRLKLFDYTAGTMETAKCVLSMRSSLESHTDKFQAYKCGLLDFSIAGQGSSTPGTKIRAFPTTSI